MGQKTAAWDGIENNTVLLTPLQGERKRSCLQDWLQKSGSRIHCRTGCTPWSEEVYVCDTPFTTYSRTVELQFNKKVDQIIQKEET
jgi:hypothetical protein